MKYPKEFYQIYGQFAGDSLSPEIIRLAKPYIKGNVLDVGAGSGRMMSLLRTSVNNLGVIHGIDIAPKNRDIDEASIDKIPYIDNFFDCIICSEVLEHLDNETLAKGLSETHRVLKPRGHVIITTPYKDNLKNNIVKCPICKTEFHRWGHIQSFDETYLFKTISMKGFIIPMMEVLPLGFMASHKILRHFISFIQNMPFVRYEQRSIFVVAQKV